MNCHTSTLRTYRERIAKQHGIVGKTNLLRWALENGLG
jgi:DNA-binding CsgD family transcriptional regulator